MKAHAVLVGALAPDGREELIQNGIEHHSNLDNLNRVSISPVQKTRKEGEKTLFKQKPMEMHEKGNL